MLLKDRNVTITGANRGIGKALVECFARQGANIWACARKADESFSKFIADLAQETGVKISPVYFDFADAQKVKEGAQAILNATEALDVLVNNAATIHTSLFQMTSIEKMKEIFDINYFNQMLFTQYILKRMTRQKRGSIINVSSSAAIEGNEGRLAYASSKSAIITSTLVMAKELAAYNIRVNAIAPGLTDTDMMRSSTQEAALQKTLDRIALKRVGRPEEIANSILFLASDLSSYMTGQVLRVDGGM